MQRLTDLVTQTEAGIARLQDDALIAAGAHEDPTFAAEQARRAETDATSALGAAEATSPTPSRPWYSWPASSYITSGQLSQDPMLLDSGSPAELVERAGLVDALSD